MSLFHSHVDKAKVVFYSKEDWERYNFLNKHRQRGCRDSKEVRNSGMMIERSELMITIEKKRAHDEVYFQRVTKNSWILFERPEFEIMEFHSCMRL